MRVSVSELNSKRLTLIKLGLLVRADGQPWQTLVRELTELHGRICQYMNANTE